MSRKLTVSTKAEPPLPKMEKRGNETFAQFGLIPKLSLPCLKLRVKVKLVSPLINAAKAGQIEA